MAQVQFNPQITGIIGKIGRETYSRVQSGYVVKTTPNPTKNRRIAPSSSQIIFRQYFSQVQRSWINCTPQQMTAWHDIAKISTFINKFGLKYSGDGYHLFLRLNQNRLIIGKPIIYDAPAVVGIHQISSIAASVVIAYKAVICLLYDGSQYSGETTYIIYSTPALSPGINYIGNEYRNIQVSQLDYYGTLGIVDNWKLKFGEPLLNKKYFFKLVPIHIASGQVGYPLFCSCISTDI